jgi:hypothetical protein
MKDREYYRDMIWFFEFMYGKRRKRRLKKAS